ncbi:hypothetical protein D6783_01670 [Candidatus Woesearchaeota archaeon]|nr:MAG: hypothetical protein D6783_01670 [Candidatus Woesearchaeota archaeon]
MVNINISISDDLHQQIKLQATLAKRTLKEHIITLLQARVQKELPPHQPNPTKKQNLTLSKRR